MVQKKSKVGKAGPIVEKVTLYVEKDPHKLVNYVCGSNIYIDGEDVKVNGSFFLQKKRRRKSADIVENTNLIFALQIKPESEYPDWLWEINVGPPKKLEELDPNTKTYWRRLRKMKHRNNNLLLSLKRRNLNNRMP